jgi:aminoglycoside 6'-N-acetyltransferase
MWARSPDGLVVRRVELGDVPVLARWLSDPRVLEHYGGRDKPLNEAGVRAHYFQRRRDRVTGRFYEYHPCIVELDGRPIGFVQFYRWPASEIVALGYSPVERTYGIDLFLGEPELWGKGSGTRVVEIVRDHLIEKREARRVVLDPGTENTRAIRAYEKAGFRKIRVMSSQEMHEGKVRDCWLMEYP